MIDGGGFEFQKPVREAIRARTSSRAYLDAPIAETAQIALSRFLAGMTHGPFGTPARLSLLASTQDAREALKGLGTYGFIKGPTGFIAGAVVRGPRNLEDYGFLLEQAVLAATDLGLGTCWLGGSFTRSRFAKRLDQRQDETMPAVVAVGNKAAGEGRRERVRTAAGSRYRLPFERLFFKEEIGRSLPTMLDEPYGQVLEMVRWAPSASNKQPWRIVRSGGAWHFYLMRTKNYGSGSLAGRLLRISDLQRVDMGIAMCHFDMVAREEGLNGSWLVRKPTTVSPGGAEYTATWREN